MTPLTKSQHADAIVRIAIKLATRRLASGSIRGDGAVLHALRSAGALLAETAGDRNPRIRELVALVHRIAGPASVAGVQNPPRRPTQVPQ